MTGMQSLTSEEMEEIKGGYSDTYGGYTFCCPAKKEEVAILTEAYRKENYDKAVNFIRFVYEIVLPGIPMLVEFDDNRIVNYYFDDKEILHFLNSETEPIGKYWNLD